MMSLNSSLRIHDLDEQHDVLRTVLGHVPGARQVASRIRGDDEGTVFDVFAFTGEEGVGRLYHFDLEITVEEGDLELERRALGRDACFEMRCDDRSRKVHGIVAEVELIERTFASNRERFRVRLVPRAHIMTLRRVSRVFQDRRVDEIIREVLALYSIPMHLHVHRRYPALAYSCQLDETDYDFVRRIAADHGLFFFFEHPADIEDGLGGAVDDLAGMGVNAIGALAGGENPGAVLGGLGGGVAGLFGPLMTGRIREVMVFADTASAYPPMDRSGGELVSRLLGQVVSMAGDALSNFAGEQLSGPVGDLAEQAIDGVTAALNEATANALLDAPRLHVREAYGAMQHDEHTVLSFVNRRALRPTHATYGHYDPRRPQAVLRHHASQGSAGDPFSAAFEQLAESALQVGMEAATSGMGAAGESPMADLARHTMLFRKPMELYEHHGGYLHPDWNDEKHVPESMLHAARRDADLSSGEGVCPWLAAGHVFQLEDHPAARLNRRYVPVSIRHRSRRLDEREAWSYQNDFTCVPSEVVFPTPWHQRGRVSVCYSAEVVGAGSIHTEQRGMIQVRFHWDREREEGKRASTCWLRVMQPWTGAGWGMQLLPRVGTEVMVGFEGGDADRPIVLGGVHNTTHPPPFALPQHRTKSGIRTRTVPGGEGGHELSFEDAHGREEIYMHASRNLRVDTVLDRAVTVGNLDHLVVRGEQRVEVMGEQHFEVRGAARTHAHGGQTFQVTGSHHVESTEATSFQARSWRVAVTENSEHEVSGRHQLRIGGNLIQRITGNFVQSVGTSDNPTSAVSHAAGNLELSAGKSLQLSADESVVIRCGKSVLRLEPETAELFSPTLVVRGSGVRAQLADSDLAVLADGNIQLKANSILLCSSGAALGLTSEASLDGSKVLLNSPAQGEDSAEESTMQPTIVELTDLEGEPIPNHAFRIVFSDGREIGGSLDDDGRAELFLEEGGDIFFPGLHDAEKR